jgi:hypothetical protein
MHPTCMCHHILIQAGIWKLDAPLARPADKPMQRQGALLRRLESEDCLASPSIPVTQYKALSFELLQNAIYRAEIGGDAAGRKCTKYALGADAVGRNGVDHLKNTNTRPGWTQIGSLEPRQNSGTHPAPSAAATR